MNHLMLIVEWMIIIAIALFVLVSVVMFIKDGIDAKKVGRKRNIVFTVMFIMSMVIVGLFIVGVIFLSILAMLVMRSM